MSHDPEPNPPLAKSPSSRRKGVPPPEQAAQDDPRRFSAVTTTEAFIAAHNVKFTTPSGESKFDIRVSDCPADWNYLAQTSTGKPFGFDPPNASMRTTDVTITACIPPQRTGKEPWREALARVNHPTARIGIAAISIAPPAPADAAWILHAVCAKYGGDDYGGIYHKLLLLCLGEHAILVSKDVKDPAAILIERIRQASIKRLQGPEPERSPWITSFSPWSITAT